MNAGVLGRCMTGFCWTYCTGGFKSIGEGVCFRLRTSHAAPTGVLTATRLDTGLRRTLIVQR